MSRPSRRSSRATAGRRSGALSRSTCPRRWADHGDDLARVGVQPDAVQHLGLAVAGVQVGDGEQLSGAGRPVPPGRPKTDAPSGAANSELGVVSSRCSTPRWAARTAGSPDFLGRAFRSAWCRTPSRRCGRRGPITRSMSCSTSRMLMPSARSWRRTAARPPFLVAQPGGRLVEQQQRRVGAQRGRSPSIRCGPSADLPARSCMRSAMPMRAQLALGLGNRRRSSARSVSASHGRPAVAAQVAARPRSQHGHVRTIFVCWKVCAMPRRAISREPPTRSGRQRDHRRAGCEQPVIRLKVVDLPAPFRADEAG